MSTAGPNTPAGEAPPRLMLLAVAGAAVLAFGSGVLFYYASQTAQKQAQAKLYRVTVGDRTCDPNALTVPAGRATFEIHNVSNRTLEWEILDGVMVLEERENITPGLRSRLTARLKPGRYEMTCGLLSNPRGTLTVTASAESEAERRKPPVKAFVGPLSEYRVALVRQSAELGKTVGRLAEAIHVGDIEAARQQYFAARLPYRRLDMVTSRFTDLKNAIDPVADYLAERESDPSFTGFHRIAYGLFVRNSTDGLAPVADRLVSDIAALNARIRALRLAPEDVGASVERQARLFAEGHIGGGENHYANGELAEIAASLESMEKSVDLLTPLLGGAAPNVVVQIAQARTSLHAALDALTREQGGRAPYDRVDQRSREQLAKAFATFADAVGNLNTSLGLEQ